MGRYLIKLHPISINDLFIPLFTITIGISALLLSIEVLVVASFQDLIVLIFFFPFIALGLVGIVYLKNKSVLIIDNINDNLTIFENKEKIFSHNLSDINSFLWKKIVSNIGSYKHELHAILNDTSTQFLFTIDQFLLPTRFISKLSRGSGKPFSQEIWVEDYDGNVSLVSDVKIQSGSEHKRVLLGGTLLIPLLGALVYTVILNKTNFLFVGVATWFVFILFIFFYSNKYFKEQPEIFKNKFMAVIAVLLSLNTTPIFLYLLSCFILSGFKMPFW